MVIALTVVAIFFAFQTGFWIGRRQRPEDHWDWTDQAVSKGWVHQLYLEDPSHYNRKGEYLYRNGD